MGKAAEDVHKSDMTAQVTEPSGRRRTRHVLSVSEASECNPHARFIHAYGAGGRVSLHRVRGVALTSVKLSLMLGIVVSHTHPSVIGFQGATRPWSCSVCLYTSR